jgi:hypothetical protein
MKVQEIAYLKAKWTKEGCSKKQLLWGNLLCVLYFLMPQGNIAQRAPHHIDIEKIVKPLKPLQDSIKTYQLVMKTEVDLPYFEIDTNLINYFSFASYEKKNTDADMILYVTIRKTIIKGQIKETRSAKDTTYRYEEQIKPQIKVELVSKSGELFFSKNGGLEWVYSTGEKKTADEAFITYDNRDKDTDVYGKRTNSYTKKLINIHTETIITWSNELKNFYDYQSELVGIFYESNDMNAKEESLLFNQHVISLKESLQLLNTNEPKTKIIEKLEPSIRFFENELNKDTSSTKEQSRYFASAWNLINTYRCLEAFDTAFFYIRLLLKNSDNPYNVKVAHIVNMKERFDEYQHYKKTKMSLEQTRQIMDSIRFEALKKISRAKGYIVVGNTNTKIEGRILDIYNNFQNNKVVIEYQRKIKEIKNTEYPLVDVKEIHIEGWHLGIIPYEKRAFDNVLLTEILYKSSKIVYYRALSARGNETQKPRQELFLQKSSQNGFTSIDETIYFNGFNIGIAKYMNDCPTISQRVRVGYYKKHHSLQLAMDYDSACSSTQRFLLPTIDSAYKPFTGYRFYAGWNTGLKSFTSLFGLTTNLSFNGKLYLRMGIGVGYWGVRYSTGIQYNVHQDMRFSKGWSFAAGYSHNSGIKSGVTLESYIDSIVLPNNTIVKTSTDYRIRPLPVNTVHFSMIHNRFYSTKIATYFELGYAIALQKPQWVVLTPNLREPSIGAKDKISIRKPGGLIIGFGCNFLFRERLRGRKKLGYSQ